MAKMYKNVGTVFGNGYYCENHTNVLTIRDEYKDPTGKVIKRTRTDKKKLLNQIYDSLYSKDTQEFIKLFIGNGQLSKTELETIIPIKLV